MKKDVFYSEMLNESDEYFHPLAKRWIKIISNVRIKCIDQVPKDLISSTENNEVKFIDDNVRYFSIESNEVNEDVYIYSLSFPFNRWTEELETALIDEVLSEANKEYHKVRFIKDLRSYLNKKTKRVIELNSDFKFSDFTSERYDIKPEVCNIIWNYDNTGVSMMYGVKEIFQKVINQLEEKTDQPDEIKEIEKVEEPKFTFKNNFNLQSEESVYNYFNDRLVISKKYIDNETLEQFLKLAFEEQQPPKNKLKWKNPPKHIVDITSIFYMFYFDNKGNRKKLRADYIKLLTDYFDGYNFDKINNNFHLLPKRSNF